MAQVTTRSERVLNKTAIAAVLVMVLAITNIYVKYLNKVKER